MNQNMTFDERTDLVQKGFEAVFGCLPEIEITDHPLDTEGEKCMIVHGVENWYIWSTESEHVLEVAVYFPATREIPEEVDYSEVGKFDWFHQLLESLVSNEAQKRLEGYLDSRDIQSLAQEVADEINSPPEEGSTDG